MRATRPFPIRPDLSLLLAGAILTACGAAPDTGTAVPAMGAAVLAPGSPTVVGQLPLPVPTGGPAVQATGRADLTAMAAEGTVFPPATPIPGLAETAVARATAAPFPTAGPASVQLGPPAVARTRRGNVVLDLRLAGAGYLAGENGQAVVMLRNDSAERLFLGDIGLAAQDEQGQRLALGPPDVDVQAGMSYASESSVFMRPLTPGATFSQTLTFQLPPAAQAAGHHYSVQASAR